MTSSMYGLLSKAPYGVYAVDMSQTILFWNRSAERILGFKANQIIGRRCYEVLRNLPEEGSTPICIESCPSIRLAREGRIPPVVHVRMLCASGRRMQATITPITFPATRSNDSILVHLFHVEADDERARRVASAVQVVLLKGSTSAPPTDLTTRATCCEAYNLTGRELEVLHLLALGLETKEIAAELHVSINTVRNHVGNLREKMSARSRPGIVLAAQRLGLI